jgi:hypothetical protein
VLVAGLQMHQLAEQALAHHLQRRHHVAAVADVLQQHVRGAGAQLGLQHVPVVLQGDAGHHFAADGHAGLHRGDRHRCVVFPRRGDDHAIDALLFQQALPGVGVAVLAIGLRRRLAGLGHHLHGTAEHDRLDVAQRDHFDVVAAHQLLQQHQAAHAGADHGQAHLAPACPGRGLRQQAAGGDSGAGRDEFPTLHGKHLSSWQRAGRSRHARSRKRNYLNR